ncbi:MAG: type II toxin-antitoxin system RelE family toxin [Blastocatellia bacterium]
MGVRNSSALHTYRIREGAYRIIYNILPDVVVVEIIKVGHRKDVYR